jgi:hypothetical protein
VEAARALTYETSRICDLENSNLLVLEWGNDLDKEEKKRRKQLSRSLKRVNSMLTPMSKYYASEMCCNVADTAVQVLGGSGYMKDYAAERYLRDARITTIYEGTSQLQIVAAVRGVSSGVFESWTEQYDKKGYDDPLLEELKQSLLEGKRCVLETVEFVKQQGPTYLDLSGRRLVDAAISVIIGHLFLEHAAENERKRRVARRFITREMLMLRTRCDQVLSGDTSPLDEYALLAGPVPSND